MSTLTAHNLSKFFGADEVFSGLSLSIPLGGKIALVGPNGAGKSTLVKLLLGLESASDGEVHIAKSTRVGYLPQNPELEGEQSVYQEMLSAFESLIALEKQLQALEAQLVNADAATLERYGRLQADFEVRGGYEYETQIKIVLRGLGFTEAQYEQRLNKLSGGQKTRAFLARLLLENPDLLILDEPTNHLDIEAIEWLESYLRNFTGSLLIVSHDRYFMDNVAQVIWELDWGEIEVYRGNYSHYVQQREERHERRMKEYEAQQAFIAKEQDYIQRNIAGQNTNQAKGRRRRLERMMSGTDRRNRPLDGQWLKKPPRRRVKLNINLQAEGRTGDQVLRTKTLQVGYSLPLFTAPDMLLLRGEVAAIIGPNGVGKSTFLKTILGQLDPLKGEAIWGAQVQIGYFAQAHEDLDPRKTLLEEILSVENLPISQARNYLGSYLFMGDDVFRPVETLSGGERGRLALAKLALAGANVLLLDEPTNHLDIPSQEILQDVLSSFKGTILLVSHDRYLIDALSTQIWHIRPGEMSIFKGTYAEYLASLKRGNVEAVNAEQGSEAKQNQNATQNGTRKKHGLNPYQLERRITALEKAIHDLQEQLSEITAAIEAASIKGNFTLIAELGERYTQTETDLNAALEEWALLAD